jgi:hypothetical protein
VGETGMASFIFRAGIIAMPVKEARIISLWGYLIVSELASKAELKLCLTSDFTTHSSHSSFSETGMQILPADLMSKTHS